MTRILSIVGTRPQLIKVAAVEPALRARFDAHLIDTAQHHDDALSGRFYRELGIPTPDLILEAPIGMGAAERLGRAIVGLDPAIRQIAPDLVVVYGDTDSTLAGALAAVRSGIPVVHIESGLRSGDMRMPEEQNRLVTDRISTLRLCPNPAAAANLRAEGINTGVIVVGDPMADLVRRLAPEVRRPIALASIAAEIGVDLQPGAFIYATLHRAEVRDRERLLAALECLRLAGHDLGLPVILPLHPGTRAAISSASISLPEGVHGIAPIGYRDSLALTAQAAAVLTDSGGVQREAAWLGTPTLVMRETTEWRELLHPAGASLLVGTDPTRIGGGLMLLGAVNDPKSLPKRFAHLLPAGGAAEAIAEAIASLAR